MPVGIGQIMQLEEFWIREKSFHLFLKNFRVEFCSIIFASFRIRRTKYITDEIQMRNRVQMRSSAAGSPSRRGGVTSHLHRAVSADLVSGVYLVADSG